MKTLHISNKPVYPLVDGGCVAMSKILQSLQQISPTTEHVFIHTPKHPFAAGAYPSDVLLPLPAEQTFIDTGVRAFPALKALISGRNYNLERFHDAGFERRLAAYVGQQEFDLIVLESLFLAPYIPALRQVTTAKLVIRAHNVEHELWQQQAADAPFGKKHYLRSLAGSLKREELQLLNTADHIWAITNEDAARFRELGIQTPVTTIPVAMEIPEITADYSCKDFFHIGSLNWEPNRKTVDRLVNDLWKIVRATTQAQLHIAGSFSEDFPVARKEGVVFHGFVEDSQVFMAAHGILAAPVTTGSGVRIKLLEAMALGVCCITTALGATGIDTSEKVLFTCEHDRRWITDMERLSRMEDVREKVGANAREYIRKYHSFATVNSLILTSLEH